MKTILVIEDNRDVRENIAEILELASYQVLQAANGKEGIATARQTRPDLILCDIMMPDLDGFGVLHILGEDAALAKVPFVFLTARARQVDFRIGMDLGADDYLTKPFKDLSLLNAVAMRLRKSEREQSTDLDKLMQALLNETDAQEALCVHYPTTHFNRKHCLYSVGSWPTTLYFICQGKVKLFNTDAAGNEFITALHGTGDFLGYLALLEESVHAETAELLEDAVVCAIPKADFLALIYHNQEVANQFTRLLAGDVTDQQERLLKLAYQSVRKRVAEALLMVQLKFYSQPTGGSTSLSTQSVDSIDPIANTSRPMTLSRENWSHLVGASVETVVRVLSDLRTEGLISLSGSEITLLDIDKLTRMKH